MPWPRWPASPVTARATCLRILSSWCAGRFRISIWALNPLGTLQRWVRSLAKSCPRDSYLTPPSWLMNELAIIEKIRKLAARGARMALGIGDDCAIYRPRRGEDLLFKIDPMIENIHFRRDQPPAVIGQRALGRNLSDIAAMGGEPKFCLVS